jgi:hypothetical protein
MGPDLKSPNRKTQKEIFIVIICLLIGFALRFYTFDQKSLWIDEVHTFNDSRDGLKGQIKYIKDEPMDLIHPPLFFVLTHLFYPFEKPERDLRIIPLIFGTLSIPMIYLLSRVFSPNIALPCTLSLTFMTYHISFSQDGRSYSLIMFLGMVSLYFFLEHLRTYKKRYLLLVGFLFAALFYTSYSSIPFIVLSQLLWFYRVNPVRNSSGALNPALRGGTPYGAEPGIILKSNPAVGGTAEQRGIISNGVNENDKKPRFSSFLILNSLTLLLCFPWALLIALKYERKLLDIGFGEDTGSFWSILLGILNDWVPLTPLMAVSIVLLIFLIIFSKQRKNALILLGVLFIPVGSLYLFCKVFDINHYFSSRYFINFLPLFFVSIYLSLDSIELKFQRLRRILRLKLLFIILFIASNMVILPLYYHSEKQDFRGLVAYLEGQLRDGDKVFVRSTAYIPGILHYFNVEPEARYYKIPLYSTDSGFEYRVSLIGQNKRFTIVYSNSCCAQYTADGSRLWIIVGKPSVKEIKEKTPCILKGYFDGSFCNFRRFPSDASMFLFLWDPLSPDEKGIDMPIE